MIWGVSIVALIGLLLSIYNFVAGIVKKVRERARIVVVLSHVLFTPSAKPRVFNVLFTVTVQNLGNKPLTVWDVGLERADGKQVSLRFGRDIVRNLLHSNPAGIDPKTFDYSDGPGLPCSIPVGGVIDWVFENVTTSNDPDTTVWRGYATRLKGVKQRTDRSKQRFERSGKLV
ncbi:hypothetical protein [Curtobacterium sp. Curtsp57]|uniref:hypothetical protein n=1 Tax=Curtobacterium sp. Curtsp57 TaxID=3243047 RepID=UPI0039B3AF95